MNYNEPRIWNNQKPIYDMSDISDIYFDAFGVDGDAGENVFSYGVIL